MTRHEMLDQLHGHVSALINCHEMLSDLYGDARNLDSEGYIARAMLNIQHAIDDLEIAAVINPAPHIR